MLIVREIFVAKPGQAGKLAKLMKAMFNADPNFKGRVMTDLVADFNNVVVESEVENLAAWEKQMEAYSKGQMPEMPPEVMEQMKNYTEMYYKGRREIYRITE